jgi:hypothetical protein
MSTLLYYTYIISSSHIHKYVHIINNIHLSHFITVGRIIDDISRVEYRNSKGAMY